VPWLAFLAGARGEWDEAARLLAEAAPQVARVDSPEPRAFLRKIQGFVLLMQGAHAEATAALEEAVAGFRPSGPATLVWYLGCLATAYQAAGEQRASEGIAAETAALVDALPPGSLPQAPALAELGVVAVLRGDRAAAACWYPRLLPFAGQLHWVLTDRVLGMLAALLGDQPAADRHFADAAALARRGGIRPELGLTLAEQGAARRQSPEPATRASAEPLLREALDLLRGLRMSADAARVAAMLRQPGGRPPPRRELPAGLSEREAEVLAMVVQGLTNRQIGARLGISEKTVTNHLTHIFTKADLDNRAAAVAFALRHGLA
jgi:DNA-binding CsgD family transcriptional regulator